MSNIFIVYYTGKDLMPGAGCNSQNILIAVRNLSGLYHANQT